MWMRFIRVASPLQEAEFFEEIVHLFVGIFRGGEVVLTKKTESSAVSVSPAKLFSLEKKPTLKLN